MRASLLEVAVSCVGVALSVVGLLGALIVASWVADGFHGVSLANAWPAMLLLTWGGISGVAVCCRARWAHRSLVAWAVASGTWVSIVATRPPDGSWLLAASLCATLLAVVGFVVRFDPRRARTQASTTPGAKT